MAKSAKSGKAPTKSEIYASVAECTGLTRKQVASVCEAVGQLVAKNLGKKGPGAFVLPGLCKMVVQHKPATKARKGRNPFTGQEIMIKAKPARNVVKIRALKQLKEMAA